MDRMSDIIDKQEWNNSVTKCPICGKGFSVINKTDYAFKIRHKSNKRTIYYCSYTCFNKGKSYE